MPEVEMTEMPEQNFWWWNSPVNMELRREVRGYRFFKILCIEAVVKALIVIGFLREERLEGRSSP